MSICAHNPLLQVHPSSDAKHCQIAKKSFLSGQKTNKAATAPMRHRQRHGKLSINLSFMIDMREKKFPSTDNHLSIIRALDEFDPGPRANSQLAESDSWLTLPAPNSTTVSNPIRFCWTKNISIHNKNPTKPQFVSISRHKRHEASGKRQSARFINRYGRRGFAELLCDIK